MEHKISSHDDGRRLDKVIRNLLKETPLGEIFKMIRKGGIKVNGKKKKQDYKLIEGDLITLPTISSTNTPRSVTTPPLKVDKYPYKILLEDENLIVIDKPSGTASQSGTGIKNDVMTITKAYYQSKTDFIPQIVHRLDKDTSGILILAKTGKALREMQKLIKERQVQKFYTAKVKGRPDLEGEIVSYLERTEGKTQKIKTSEDGKKAISKYEVFESDGETSVLKVQIVTGRMHQIRVHLADLGNPILGDTKYGDFAWNRQMKTKRLYLHSTEMSFELFNKKYKIISNPNW